MKKIALLSLTLLAGGGLALATTVNCTVITGGVVTASLDVAKIFAGESGGSLGSIQLSRNQSWRRTFNQ